MEVPEERPPCQVNVPLCHPATPWVVAAICAVAHTHTHTGHMRALFVDALQMSSASSTAHANWGSGQANHEQHIEHGRSNDSAKANVILCLGMQSLACVTKRSP